MFIDLERERERNVNGLPPARILTGMEHATLCGLGQSPNKPSHPTRASRNILLKNNIYSEKCTYVISVQLNELSQSEHIHLTNTHDQGQEIEHKVHKGALWDDKSVPAMS